MKLDPGHVLSSFFSGGFAGAANALVSDLFEGPQQPKAVAPARSGDSVSETLSDNSTLVSRAMIQAQEFQVQQASLDRQMQLAAGITLGIERLETKLETSKLDYFQNMTVEENRHIEKMARLSSHETADLPPPHFTED